MSEASLTSLGELGSFARGQGGTKRDARRSGVPCLRYGELYTVHDVRIRQFTSFIDPLVTPRYTLLQVGDIVFAASGETHEEIGKNAVFTGEEIAVAGSDTIIFTPKPGNDVVFLSYATNHDQAARFKAQRGQGSSVIHIGARHLQELPVWLPPLPEQQRIAEILDTIDDAIRKTEEIIAKLKQVKQGLLHDLLTRGIDDNGELRDPERHPEQFKDSPLGRIPKGWDVRSCMEISQAITVGIVVRPTQYYRATGVTVLRSANVREEGVVLTDLKYMSEKDHRALTKTSVSPGDLVTVRTGYPGTTAVIPHTLGTANCVDIIITRPAPQIDAHFLTTWINSDFGKGQVLAKQGGLAQQHFNVGEMKELLVVVPFLAEQRRIAGRLGTLAARVSLEGERKAKLLLLKRGLMEDLLTGRVRVTPLLRDVAE